MGGGEISHVERVARNALAHAVCYKILTAHIRDFKPKFRHSKRVDRNAARIPDHVSASVLRVPYSRTKLSL